MTGGNSMSTIVVNLFGAQSCDKSTGAAYVFSSLKLCGVNAELVMEFDKVWDENPEIYKKPLNQAYIFGKQFYNLSQCYDKADVIVTGNPLLLSSLYNKSEVLGEEFDKTVMKCFKMFDNRSYLLEPSTQNNLYVEFDGKLQSFGVMDRNNRIYNIDNMQKCINSGTKIQTLLHDNSGLGECDYPTSKYKDKQLSSERILNPVGRFQTEEESNKIQDELISKLKEWGILYKTVRGNMDGYNSIVDDILTELRGE